MAQSRVRNKVCEAEEVVEKAENVDFAKDVDNVFLLRLEGSLVRD